MRFNQLLVMFFAGLGNPVLAQTPAVTPLPALYVVGNISEGTILNVRSGPGVANKDIGDLRLGVQVEVTRLSTDGLWARINWNQSTGWLSTEYLSLIDGTKLPDSQMPASMTCFGNAPGWIAHIQNGEAIELAREGGEAQQELLLWERQSANHALRGAIATQSWVLAIEKRVCSLGGDDQLYGLQADLIGKGSDPLALSGCCSVQISD